MKLHGLKKLEKLRRRERAGWFIGGLITLWFGFPSVLTGIVPIIGIAIPQSLAISLTLGGTAAMIVGATT